MSKNSINRIKWSLSTTKKLLAYGMLTAALASNLACSSPKTRDEIRLEQLKEKRDELEEEKEVKDKIHETEAEINELKYPKPKKSSIRKVVDRTRAQTDSIATALGSNKPVKMTDYIKIRYNNWDVNKINDSLYTDDTNIYIWKQWGKESEIVLDVIHGKTRPEIYPNSILIKINWFSWVFDSEKDTYAIVRKRSKKVTHFTWLHSKAITKAK